MALVVKIGNPIDWIAGHIPKNRGQLEATARSLLKIVFWFALLAPVVLIPAYYLLVAFGVLPPIRLPAG